MATILDSLTRSVEHAEKMLDMRVKARDRAAALLPRFVERVEASARLLDYWDRDKHPAEWERANRRYAAFQDSLKGMEARVAECDYAVVKAKEDVREARERYDSMAKRIARLKK